MLFLQENRILEIKTIFLWLLSLPRFNSAAYATLLYAVQLATPPPTCAAPRDSQHIGLLLFGLSWFFRPFFVEIAVLGFIFSDLVIFFLFVDQIRICVYNA